MQRSAVFVDAGYLFAQGSVALTGERQARELLSLDIPSMVSVLRDTASATCNLPMLRIYWYDAMRLGRPTPEQTQLADANEIKVRLGQINAAGEQKGVDALIITDLAELARNQAIADAVLVSGDEDLRVGVLLAQQFGVRVHLVGIHPARGNQSRSLRQEADTTIEWDPSSIALFLRYTPPASDEASSRGAASTGLEALIQDQIDRIPPADLAGLKLHFVENSDVPSDHDRNLLRIGRDHHGQTTLTSSEKTILRETFVRLVKARPAG